MKRVKGYVVGYDNKRGELLWKVKVKDPGSFHDGKKFEVVSLHPGTMITKQSVDVTFRVREFNIGRIEQEMVLKAVDVSLGLNEPNDEIVDVEKVTESMSFALVDEGGQIYAWYNECETHDECREWLREKSDECHLLDFVRISDSAFGQNGLYGWDESAEAAFIGLKKMTEIDGVRKALEAIVTETFMLKRQ